MSVESFKKKFLRNRFYGISVLELRTKIEFSDNMLFEENDKTLKFIFHRTLKDMRYKLLEEFDKAFRELEKD